MQYSAQDIAMLDNINETGLTLDDLPEDNFIFITLAPYLDSFLPLLKKLKPAEMQQLFFKYPGVMAVVKMLESEAKNMEKKLSKR